MIHTLTALQGAEHLLITAARLWAAAGELITAGAILWLLDTLARAIRGERIVSAVLDEEACTREQCHSSCLTKRRQVDINHHL